VLVSAVAGRRRGWFQAVQVRVPGVLRWRVLGAVLRRVVRQQVLEAVQRPRVLEAVQQRVLGRRAWMG